MSGSRQTRRLRPAEIAWRFGKTFPDWYDTAARARAAGLKGEECRDVFRACYVPRDVSVHYFGRRPGGAWLTCPPCRASGAERQTRTKKSPRRNDGPPGASALPHVCGRRDLATVGTVYPPSGAGSRFIYCFTFCSFACNAAPSSRTAPGLFQTRNTGCRS